MAGVPKASDGNNQSNILITRWNNSRLWEQVGGFNEILTSKKRG